MIDMQEGRGIFNIFCESGGRGRLICKLFDYHAKAQRGAALMLWGSFASRLLRVR